MEVIEEFAANSRGWSNERHNMKTVAAIEEQEESNLAKELAALRDAPSAIISKIVVVQIGYIAIIALIRGI
ncbi:hypothetical protein AAHA92_10346 [Salvia divinorum]|uniref:Uncharacterized protein n=1 Tax=Salvia divinorum TaxID=28513 RepID=A0ABD1HUC5_SALDI